jgi:hypothetical protein
LYTFMISHACYMPLPYHPQYDHPNNIWWSALIPVSLLVALYPVFIALPCLVSKW